MNENVPISQWVERWYYVLASHRPSQLGWRAVKLLQRRGVPLLTGSVDECADLTLTPRNNRGFDDVLARHLAVRTERGNVSDRVERLLAGEFRFLNESRTLGACTDGSMSEVEPTSHLWRFHLHYQEYLLDLLASARGGLQPEAADRIWPIVAAWMRDHPIERVRTLHDAWHPFCLSRRIPVWLMLRHAEVVPPSESDRFDRCLESQTRYLERHLEWDLRGNHLFENLRALALVGSYWAGEAADARLAMAHRLIKTQLHEQLLDSGEHFERSPMYHAQMLLALLDIRDGTRDVRPVLSQLCDDAARRMAVFLRQILHPDGQIPLLSDSALEETPSPRLLIEQALAEKASPVTDVPDVSPPSDAVASPERGNSPREPAFGATNVGGYWIWRDGGDALLFDHGPVGADELPAHAHCDLLTIEASLHGERLIVDTGVFDYADSEMRRICRSTAAHNVLQVDGLEQCDVWSRFRMGRRGRPTGFAAGAAGDFHWAAARHDAYARYEVPQVGRWIACRPGGPWIVADWADGHDQHQLTSWLHFAPAVRVSRGGQREAVLTGGEQTARLRYLTPGTMTVGHGWYCPDFGVRQNAPLIRFEHSVVLPTMIVWVLSWNDGDDGCSVESDASDKVRIIWESEGQRIEWSPRSLIVC